MQTLNNKAFRVSVQWNALVRKPLSLGRGGFTKDFRSSVLGSLHAYGLELEDQANLQALVIAGIDSVFRCAEVSNNGVLGSKTYKNHTKAQILKLSQEALKFKQNLIIFYGREKERLNAVTSLEALEKFVIKEYLT